MDFFDDQKNKNRLVSDETTNFDTRKTNLSMQSFDSANVVVSIDHATQNYVVQEGSNAPQLFPLSSPVTFSIKNGKLYVGAIALDETERVDSTSFIFKNALNTCYTTLKLEGEFLVIGEVDVINGLQHSIETSKKFIGVGARRGDLGAKLDLKTASKLSIDLGVVLDGQIA